MQKKVIKTDLASVAALQKYLDNLNALYAKSSNNRNEILKLKPKIKSLIDEIDSFDNESQSIYKKAQQAYKDYQSKAKELGLDTNGSKGEDLMLQINGASIFPTKKEVINILNIG